MTRAGGQLGRSQPAISNALRRLRVALKDDLLVRGANGMMLTPRAERLTLAVVPPLLDRLQRLAPNMALQVLTADRQQALDLLDKDRIDLALGWVDQKPRHFHAEFLLDEELNCVFRGGHPILKSKFTIKSVLSYPHLIVSATGGRIAIFDELLAHHKFKRHALVAVTNFTAVPEMLARSNMIGVFTKLASEVFEKSFGLIKRRVPVAVGKIATNMVWHARMHNDSKHTWLRQQIKEVYRDF